jgi:hypothetical protein
VAVSRLRARLMIAAKIAAIMNQFRAGCDRIFDHR